MTIRGLVRGKKNLSVQMCFELLEESGIESILGFHADLVEEKE